MGKTRTWGELPPKAFFGGILPRKDATQTPGKRVLSRDQPSSGKPAGILGYICYAPFASDPSRDIGLQVIL